MAMAVRPVFCELSSTKPAVPVQVQRVRGSELSPTTTDNVKIVLQPRLCTLRSYGSDRPGVMRTRKDGRDEVSAFFATLSDYIESSKKSQDIETISGRLAMVGLVHRFTRVKVVTRSLPRCDSRGIFGCSKPLPSEWEIEAKVCSMEMEFWWKFLKVTLTTEVVTGNSLFRKMELQGIAEAAGVCFAAVTCAATFAWFSSARNRVGRIFTVGCNSFIDSLIDQIVDGLF